MDDAMFRRLAEQSPALIAVFSVEGRFEWANSDSWLRDLGWSAADLSTLRFADLVHPDDANDVADALLARRDTDPEDPGARCKGRLRTKGGEWKWFEWFVDLLGNGVFQGRDLTATMAYQAHLNEKLQLLDLAEQVGNVGHWSLDISTNKLTCSPQIYRIHGVDPNSSPAVLAEAFGAYHPDDRALVRATIAKSIAQGTPFSFEARLVRGDGEIRTVMSRGGCSINPQTGLAQTLFGAFVDVTERDALARDRHLVAIGTLAAGVGHEINNPLTVIQSCLEYVLDDLGSPGGKVDGNNQDLREALADASLAVDRIREISRGLQMMSRDPSDESPIEVGPLIQGAVSLTMHLVRPRAHLVFELGATPPILANETSLSQVLVSLIRNAVEAFVTDEAAQNRITIRTRLDPTGSVEISVEDNGPGIAPDVLPRIFDPFFTTRRHRNAGLGLSGAQALVRSLGGDIHCDSRSGEGTAFLVRLPQILPK